MALFGLPGNPHANFYSKTALGQLLTSATGPPFSACEVLQAQA